MAGPPRGQRSSRPIAEGQWSVDVQEQRQRTSGLAGGGEWCEIGMESGSASIYGHIARIAKEQHGVVTRTQLFELGLGKGAIDNWLRVGRLHGLHRGVYALGHAALPPFGAEMAAVLATGDGALLSHHSAVYGWGLGSRPPTIDVTVLRGRPSSRDRIRIHRATHLEGRDIRRRHGLPLTSPERALIDVAPQLAAREFERLLDEALITKLISRRSISMALDRYPRRRGSAILRELAGGDRPTTITRSEGEERLLALIRQAGLPEPQINARFGGFEIDFLWPRERVAVELDGFAYHASRAALERDHAKDLMLQTAGFIAIRISGRRLLHHPVMVVAMIAGALARGGANGPR